ncbi:hypothetical protein JCM3775_006309 [Rhodotorula graminis]
MGAAQQNRPEDLDDRCLAKYGVLDNRFGQNPCEVARVLLDMCAPQAYYSLPALDVVANQTHYPSPNPYQATECQCSMGVYNLLQGCAACQQEAPYQSTLWTDWVANCTMSNINGGQVFPYACPGDVEIPPWAWQNNANGALSVGQIFRNAYGNPQTSLSSSSTTSPPATATSDYTELSGKQTVTSVPAGDISDEQAERNTDKSVMAALLAVLIPVVVITLVVVGVCVYLRKKRRRFRGRGHKLDSSAELPEHGAHHLYDGSDATSSTAGFSSSTAGGAGAGASGFMKQKDSGVSVFAARPAAPQRSSTARSFTTNSVSTGVPVGAYGDRLGYRESTLYSASTGFDTLTRSSAFSYDPSGDSYRDHDDASLADTTAHRHLDDDDESISPFADIHRPAPSLTTTRDNIHSAPHAPASSSSAYARSFSTFSLSASTTRSSTGGGGGGGGDGPVVGSSRTTLEPDAASLRTTASSQGAPPSSSGATYGGAREDEEDGDDDEGLSERGSLRR